jgi:hypothetical protein
LTEFEFEFSPILKDGGGVGNGDICIHPELDPKPAPLISNYILPLLDLQTLKQSFKLYSHICFYF